MTNAPFNEAAWTARLGAALEAVAARAQPVYHALFYPADESSYYQQSFPSLAAQAKHDQAAALLFKDTHVLLESEPTEAVAVLQEHPLLRKAVVGSGAELAFWFRILDASTRGSLTGLVGCLAKLSIKEGGTEAAERLHRYLENGGSGSVPGHEMVFFHGLVGDSRFDLGAGAYLAPYRHVKASFSIPSLVERSLDRNQPNAAVLVRGIKYGPGIEPLETRPSSDRVSYSFPVDYEVDGLRGWWEERQLLADLFSVAARCPVLSRTRCILLDDWVRELAPTLDLGIQDSTEVIPNAWPREHEVTQGNVEKFVELLRGMYTPHRPGAVHLAANRLSSSFSRFGRPFALEDRILDVAISLEALSGGDNKKKIGRRLAALLESSGESQIRVFEQARRFYDARSAIMHWGKPTPERDALDSELASGHALARRTLEALLRLDSNSPWEEVMRGLKPDAQRYIDKNGTPHESGRS